MLPGGQGYARVVTSGIFSPRLVTAWQGESYEYMAGTPGGFYRGLIFGRLMPLWYFGLERLGVREVGDKCKVLTRGVDAAVAAVAEYTAEIGVVGVW